MLQRQGGDLPEWILWMDGTMVERRQSPDLPRSSLHIDHPSSTNQTYFGNSTETRVGQRPTKRLVQTISGPFPQMATALTTNKTTTLLFSSTTSRRRGWWLATVTVLAKRTFRLRQPFSVSSSFYFQFPCLTSRSQKISVRIRIESAAVYHHDPHSVRTWPTLPWTPSTSSWTCSFGALLGQPEKHWKRSTSCTWSLLLRTSQNGTPGWRTSEHTSTWPSTLLFGTQHHSHAHWPSPRSRLQDCHYKTRFFTYTHTLYSIWCLWPHARTTWQLSSSTTQKVCLPSQQKCSSDGG